MNALSIQGLRRLATGAIAQARPAARPAARPMLAVASVRSGVRAPIRTASTEAAAPAAPMEDTTPYRSPPRKLKSGDRPDGAKRFKKTKEATFKENHGEQIWVFEHIVTGHVIYSHSPVVNSRRAFDQILFHGKQTVPSKLRKDYWRPMMLVQFHAGEGYIGRNVFQKLREFRKMHELSWGYQEADLRKASRKERGELLCNQRENSIADVAAVLGGAGQGSHIWVAGQVEGQEGQEGTATEAQLAKATVFWANDRDRLIASKWTPNVVHVDGLPELKAKWRKRSLEAFDVDDVPAEAEAEPAKQ